MTDRNTPPPPGDERPPYRMAAAVALGVLALYILTLAPTTQFWDTSEYIAAAKVLGIPHPPGNPLFVILAHVWGMVPFHPHYAFRINLLSAACSAVASGLLFLVAERFLRCVVAARWPRRFTALAGTVVGATMFTVWNQSVVNEKVYTVSLASIALILWLAVRWADRPAGPARDKVLLLIGYLIVLSSTSHMMGVLVAPAVLVLLWWFDPRGTFRPWVLILGVAALLAVTGVWTRLIEGPDEWRVYVALLIAATLGLAAWRDPHTFARPMLYVALGAVVVGISLNFVFLPIRAAHYPPINEGEPTNWNGLLAVLGREQYQKPPITMRMADFPSQVGNYLQYFGWQFGRDWSDRTARVLAGVFGAIGLYGAVEQWLRDRRRAAAMTALMFTVTLLLVYYLNFRYGFSYRSREALDREVRERDYFFVASFQLWGLWVAMGLGALYRQLHSLLRTHLRVRPAWGAAAPVLLLALVPLGGNRRSASRAGERLARDFAVDLLQSVEPYAILITAGDNDLFPLWYAQEVEGVRQDVLVFNQSLMNTDWHLRQLLRQPQRPFDGEHAIAMYQGFTDPPPARPPLDVSVAGVDSLPLYWDVPRRSRLRVGDVEAVLQQGRYTRADLVTLQLIQQNLGVRPIYFAQTTARTADEMGLTAYLRGEGLVRRLVDHPLQQSDSVIGIQGLGWIDLARGERLLFDVYHPESAARARPRGWVDPPSDNILSLYYLTYASYAELVRRLADSTDAEHRRRGAVADSLASAMLAQLPIPSPR